MKKISQFLVLAVIITFSACKKDELESKKEELAEHKKAVAELNGKIKELEKEIAKADTSSKNSERAAKHVVVQPISAGAFNHYLEVQGKVDSDKNLDVRPLMSGSVTTISVQRGQRVKRGQVLARLDADVVLKGLEEVKSSLAFATTMYEKQKRLWDQQIGTEVQYLSAKNNKEAAEKRLSTMNEQYEYTMIKSPIDGVVDEIFIKEGELVAPTTPTPAFRVISTSGYKVRAEIPESYISKIQPGDEVKIFLPDLHDTISTKLTTVSEVINPTNRTFMVEVNVSGVKKEFRGNMSANVKILDYKNENALSIPVNVIQHGEQGDYVYVVENNKAKKKFVKVGNTYRDKAEILEGISAGENLVTVGYQELVDGESVKL